jgi:hypothetical protein
MLSFWAIFYVCSCRSSVSILFVLLCCSGADPLRAEP